MNKFSVPSISEVRLDGVSPTRAGIGPLKFFRIDDIPAGINVTAKLLTRHGQTAAIPLVNNSRIESEETLDDVEFFADQACLIHPKWSHGVRVIQDTAGSASPGPAGFSAVQYNAGTDFLLAAWATIKTFITGMLWDQSNTGAGPFEDRPLTSTFDSNSLRVGADNVENTFYIDFGTDRPLGGLPGFQCARLSFSGGLATMGGDTIAVTDYHGGPIPIFDANAGAWIYTGIIPATAKTVYVPLTGIGVPGAILHRSLPNGAANGVVGLSPWPMPNMV